MFRAAVSAALLLGCSLGCAPRAPVLPSPHTGEAPPKGPHRWTVELHSGDDVAEAEEIASAARLRFDEPIVVEHIGGTYHVRVGGFPTEDEARALAAVARERGYRTARAVPIRPESPQS